MDSTLKVCRTCGVAKPATPEHFHYRAESGKLRNECIPCWRERCRAKYRSDPQPYIARAAAWAKTHPKPRKPRPVREPGKRVLTLEQREAAKERHLRWREQNRGKLRLVGKEWRETAKGRAQHAASERRRRAAKAGSGGSHTPEDVQRALALQAGRCYWCGEPLPETGWHVDHIIPLAKGGGNGPENICVACQPCNNRKHAKMPWEFTGRLI